MKKFISVLSLLLVVVLLTAAMPVLAVDSFGCEYNNVLATYELAFYGTSGAYYSVDFEGSYIGFNNQTVGPEVKVCQAFARAITGRSIAIDGIWGQQSDTALRAAQYIMGVTADGICGPSTWYAFKAYFGITGQVPPPVIRNLL